jgi:hypothetical protein
VYGYRGIAPSIPNLVFKIIHYFQADMYILVLSVTVENKFPGIQDYRSIEIIHTKYFYLWSLSPENVNIKVLRERIMKNHYRCTQQNSWSSVHLPILHLQQSHIKIDQLLIALFQVAHELHIAHGGFWCGSPLTEGAAPNWQEILYYSNMLFQTKSNFICNSF